MLTRPKRYLGIRSEDRRPIQPREYGLLVMTGLALLVLIARLWYLQVLHGDELTARAELVRTRLIRIPPPRGLIVDRQGSTLATNRAQIVVSVLPDQLRRNPQRIPLVASRLKISPDELRALVMNPRINPYVPLVVLKGVSYEEAVDLLESQYNLPEVEVSLQAMRWYPYGKLFAHVVGYVGQISEEELKAYRQKASSEWQVADSESPLPVRSLYDGTDFVGKNGLEREYERYLHGLPGGEQVEVTPLGKRVRTLQQLEPVPGARLVLSLDLKLQQRAFELLQGHVGALVALDPRTGEVLACVSCPAFDPNLFVPRIPADIWRTLLNDPRAPLNNRVIQSAYAPGSTFKPFVALAGLETGVLTTYSSIVCPGGYQSGGRFFRCWRRHGYVEFYNSIALSCDTFYYIAAQKLGPERLAHWSRAFGLGAPTGIDLPHERHGLVPDPEWKLQTFKQPWFGGETLNYGIGQGYLLTTPLQMAVATMGIANRGVIYRPHLVRQIIAPDGSVLYNAQPEVIHRVQASPAHWDAVIEGMVRVVERGTAQRARIAGVQVAGKTGSAEFRKGGKTHSWFIAFAPAENPRVVVCVIAEEAGHGSEVAVPIAAEWLKTFFQQSDSSFADQRR
ncbi:Peptidoglycan D,D-transpeptidase MrdA [bacterium HR15]|nr:Peptidoglycan D,D-transpeptidase MrdA [bacterium HR15]